jgi:NAD(P)-dependent dehydrogenase (short-subunit alcohol dehydrogenase family)
MTDRSLAANVFDLTGSVVWITGSSRGIGAGIAVHMARHGAAVVVHGRSSGSTDEVAAEIGRLGGEVLAVHADIRDEVAAEGVVASIEERFGRLDGVVANVGGAGFGSVAATEAARFARQLDLNVVASYATLRASHPLLAASGGSAVMISATAASDPTPMFAGYGAAKAAVEHLAGSMAAEWGPGVRVNAVSPGLIRTEGSMTAVFRGSEELAARAGSTTAVGRIGETSDIAWACHYLLSSAAAFVSGATLVVDGGPTEGPTQRILRAIEES